ncbi:hypothetical protein BAY60_25085 [Prauserella muralis]|uniref:Response regulatory domain-containing protein n=2 Tax=Prauserella muralis TaxID=588067 RepID=A0A2V4AKG3_9PSEU|nr:hypothetical protein BAY60_25085 [Prauserella muralis]
MGAGEIRLLLVEDHSMVAMALTSAFEVVDDIVLVGEAASIAEALEAVERERPDIVLLDRRLPDGDGLDAIAPLRLRSPGSRVLVFTGVADAADAARAAEAGGAGLVLKAGKLDDLLETIRRVAAGQDAFDTDGRPPGP